MKSSSENIHKKKKKEGEQTTENESRGRKEVGFQAAKASLI
jgi:hypothetical protein